MKVKIFVVLILFLGVFSVWYLVPKRYVTTLDGVYYQLGNEKVFEKVSIHLDGKLRNHINGKRTFNGVVSFEGKEIPEIPKDQTELLLIYKGGNLSPIFSGFKVSEGVATAQVYNYGMMYTNDQFNLFTITVFTIGDSGTRTWTPSNGFMITAPAETREEALSISQKLINKFGIQ